jgi:beta-galactosidase/beta-glucuronidase
VTDLPQRRAAEAQGEPATNQDHAGVGVAVPDSIHEFRIRRLLEMGCNAYRCAHNPPAPEILDACDRLGMLVIDESRNFGSSPEHLEQLRTMVRRDRNHPSVVLWSICIRGSNPGHLDRREHCADDAGGGEGT